MKRYLYIVFIISIFAILANVISYYSDRTVEEAGVSILFGIVGVLIVDRLDIK